MHLLGIVTQKKDILNEAVRWYRQSFEMYRNIYGQDADHPNVSAILHCLRCVFEEKDIPRVADEC